MSKLDDILISRPVHTLKPGTEDVVGGINPTKKQIKDLFLELAEEAYLEKHKFATAMARWLDDYRKKVNEL